MTQLVVGNVTLPETSNDKYYCTTELLTKQLEMCNGRIVEEVRGSVYVIHYEYDFMGNALMRDLLSVLRGGGSFQVQFLSDDSTALQTSYFVCTEKPVPKFAFSRYGDAQWHNIAFTLREASPHD